MLYRITVRGRLGSRLLILLGEVTEETTGEASTYTLDLIDQADLYGLIELLHRAGVELISVVEVPLQG